MIFLDECTKSYDQFDSIGLYKYVRRALRGLGLVGVFMGTNAKINNFVCRGSTSGSRGDDKRIWSYVVHRLAAVPLSYIEERKANALRMIAQVVDGSELAAAKRFIEQVYHAVRDEKPWFCHLIFDFFENTATLSAILRNSHGVFDALGCLQECIESVFVTFKIRKRVGINAQPNHDKDYSFANLQMLSPEYFDDAKSGFEVNGGIHSHIAFLHVHECICHPMVTRISYFGTKLHGNEIIYVTNSTNKNVRFTILQRFNPFRMEPIGQLLFVSREGVGCLFIKTSNSQVQRLSTRRFVDRLRDSFLARTNTIVTSMRWSTFELVTGISALIATFGNGLRGIGFREWLKVFLSELHADRAMREIDFDCRVDGGTSFGKAFARHLDTIIPFCAPSLKAGWPGEFGKYLWDECGAVIGTVEADLKNASRDFFIQRLGDGEVVLSGECKSHTKPVTWGGLVNAVETLHGFGTGLNLIVYSGKVGEEFKPSQNLVFPANVSIFVLREGRERYEFERLSVGRSADDDLFIVVEVS